jgi:hypothetical protein
MDLLEMLTGKGSNQQEYEDFVNLRAGCRESFRSRQ